jgi:hypothetical protein
MVEIRYHPTLKPKLPAEQLAFSLPHLEYEKVEMAECSWIVVSVSTSICFGYFSQNPLLAQLCERFSCRYHEIHVESSSVKNKKCSLCGNVGGPYQEVLRVLMLFDEVYLTAFLNKSREVFQWSEGRLTFPSHHVLRKVHPAAKKTQVILSVTKYLDCR